MLQQRLEEERLVSSVIWAIPEDAEKENSAPRQPTLLNDEGAAALPGETEKQEVSALSAAFQELVSIKGDGEGDVTRSRGEEYYELVSAVFENCHILDQMRYVLNFQVPF